MRERYFILENKKPVATDMMTWAQWLEDREGDKHVAKTDVGKLWVSTVFLGLNHQFVDGPPILFETMVFPQDDFGELYSDRCATWEEAEAMHERGVAWAKEEEKIR